MMIVGTVFDKDEAKEIEFMVRLFVVGRRARELARKV